MKNIANQDLSKRMIHWLLAVLIIIYLVTDFGITEFRIVVTLTLGLLTNNSCRKSKSVLEEVYSRLITQLI